MNTMPNPTSHHTIPRNDSFSAEELKQAFAASESKPRNDRALKIVKQDDHKAFAPPPPSPQHHSRPASRAGYRR